MSARTIAIIGCGNMGSAIAKGLSVAAGKWSISLFDADFEKAKALEHKGAAAYSDLEEAVATSELLLLAVKPYVVEEVLQKIAPLFGAHPPVLISIAAGVTVATLRAVVPSSWQVVRVMPNIACTALAGVSAMYSDSEKARSIAAEIFETVGTVALADSESDLDIYTALSAGGPAFFCEAVEGLIQGAERMGLSRADASRAAAATLKGTGALLMHSGEAPLVWRDRVATPGGTTERGLAVLSSAAMIEAFAAAVEASTKRARENLSKK